MDKMIGEPCSCLGVDIQTVVNAEGKKVVCFNYCSDNVDPAFLGSVLEIFREAQPERRKQPKSRTAQIDFFIKAPPPIY